MPEDLAAIWEAIDHARSIGDDDTADRLIVEAAAA